MPHKKNCALTFVRQLCAAVLLALGLTLSAFGRPAAGEGPVRYVAMTPDRAAPGQQVTLAGSGWQPHDILTATVCETDGFLGICGALSAPFQADADGAFSLTTRVPRTLFDSIVDATVPLIHVVPGGYTVIVSGGLHDRVQLELTVAAPPDSALLWGELTLTARDDPAAPQDEPEQADQAEQPGPPGLPVGTVVTIGAAAPSGQTVRGALDSRGRYMHWPVTPGAYTIQAEAPVGDTRHVATTRAVLRAGETARVDLRLRARGAFPDDPRCFGETRFCVEQDAFWAHFTDLGGEATVGAPISRAFPLLGCVVQLFQHRVLQQCRVDALAGVMNLLDPPLLTGTRIGGATVPEYEFAVAEAAPLPETPYYGAAVPAHLEATVPETYNGMPVGFLSAFLAAAPAAQPAREPGAAALAGLALWGFPTSQPAVDPANPGVVSQRFQRGVMQFDAAAGQTRGLPVGDHLRHLMLGDTAEDGPSGGAEPAGGRVARQYCRESPGWLCRPGELPATDLGAAFEPESDRSVADDDAANGG
jgi:hypothetical protein